ncbi:MAG TPA: TonB-dependent receptor [Phnomibacter sp.]|nr:TonB-dependent receptor [Phnomibacter sp.]
MKKIYLCLLLLVTAGWAIAQSNAVIKGKISSSDKQPVPFVTVALQQTQRATTAGEDGHFEIINVKPGTYTIEVSAVGLLSQTKQVTVSHGGTVEVSFELKEDARQLDNVVVNARRRMNQKVVSIGKAGISPMDLPQAVSVVDEAMLKEQQANRLSDAIRNVNGISMGSQRASTQETFFARGYNMGAGNYFKNGSRSNSSGMPEMSGLEKVEVLKGSAAILYGNVSPGGIINMVTKKPKFNFGGEVSLRAGSYGLVKPSFDVYGPINKNIAYRLNGTYEKANSFRDEVSSERFYVNPSFLFKLGKNTELVVEGDYLYHEFTPDFGIGSLADTIITPVPRNTFYGVSWQYAKTQQASASAALRHSINDNWQLNVTSSYQNYSRDYFSTERIQAKANGDWARPMARTYTAQDYGVITADLTGQFKTWKLEHKLLVGADADMYDDINDRYALNSLKAGIYDTINLLNSNKYKARTDVPVATKTYLTHTPTTRFGAYVQDLISITSKLKLLAGIRWSTQSVGVPDTTYSTTGKNANGVGDNTVNSAFSPRLGLVYKPFNNTTVFASYANSFVVNSGTDVYGAALDPSTINQYEIGVKNDFYGGMLSLNVTAYRIKNNNLAQTAPFLADGTTPNNNTNIKQLTGETTSDGVEVDVLAQPIRGLHVNAGYSWNYLRYTETPDAKGNYEEGERLVGAPEHTANMSAFYTIQNGALSRLKFGAQLFYTGDRVGGWNNQKQQTQTYDRRIFVDGFTTLDLSVGYTWKSISALARVSNVTNTYSYYVHENYSVNPIPPTQFLATVAYRF